jgi:rfaE bifunctional protein kinase chain/domain
MGLIATLRRSRRRWTHAATRKPNRVSRQSKRPAARTARCLSHWNQEGRSLRSGATSWRTVEKPTFARTGAVPPDERICSVAGLGLCLLFVKELPQRELGTEGSAMGGLRRATSQRDCSDADSAVAEIRLRAEPDARIAFVSGNFNVVHPGHLRLLQFAAENCDFLVVGVTHDSTPGVTVPQSLRLDGIRSISLVNYSQALTGEPHEFISKLRPHLVVKGKEYETRENPEYAVVSQYGGHLVFASGEMRFSSLDLLRREYFEATSSAISLPRDYPPRHQFELREIRRMLSALNGVRVLVIGDLIVDTYIDCDPLGMSQEDATIVVSPISSQQFVGGAAIVAAHCRSLGASARYLTVAGYDAEADFARDRLSEFGVDAEVVADETRPTTHKKRYRANGKTLLRVSDLRQHSIEPAIAARFVQHVESLLPKVDIILFSDFNYGCLPQPIVDEICSRAARSGVRLFADSQASSQFANVGRFKGMRLITPTEREARLSVGDFESGLVVLAERLQEQARADNVVITLGAEGLLVRSVDDGEPKTDRLPAFNSMPKDVSGAGDSFFACASLALGAGVDIWRSSYLGALAAAFQVSRVGNLPVSPRDLLSELDLTAL